MNSRNVGIAALAALLLLIVGLVFRPHTERSTASDNQSDLRFFPSLIDQINDVARVTLADTVQTCTLEKRADSWVLQEKSGYPADMQKVRQTLIAIAELRKLDPKTSSPELYERLGVRDIDAAGSAATRVEVTGDDGAQLAQLLVGKRRSGAGDPAFYVRRVGEAQAWLVAGDLRLQTDPKAWLDRNIMAIKADRLQTVEIQHPDGEKLQVAKADRTAKRFDVQDLPAGRELRYATIGDGVGRALERLTFDDVWSAADTESPKDVVTATFRGFDGVVIRAELWQTDDQRLARFKASFDEQAVEPAAPPGEVSDSTAVVDEEPEGAKLELASPEDVREEVAELNRRLEPWIYVLPTYSYDRMAKRMAEMLKEPTASES
jgi:hypothetical protein